MAEEFERSDRFSGILLHPSSLPSWGGIGDFGPAASQFIDWLATARQALWQVLPLGPLGMGNSPYSSLSAFAGNPLLISLERLADRGWISRSRLRDLPGDSGPVDYAAVEAAKLPMLHEAATNFLAQAPPAARARFEDFKRDQSGWLEDYVLFAALRQCYSQCSWNQWPREFAARDPHALAHFREENAVHLEISRVLQFVFQEQWRALHHACRERGIRLVGDVAIFVNYDSVDVWTHPEFFHLDEYFNPVTVAGVPPDAFSATGQRWGNPLYRWDVLRRRGYDWWVRRMRSALENCDLVRLDHFRGFQQYWEIPSGQETAMHGRWVDGPGDELFEAMRQQLGSLPIIAEDLGHITPDVHALRHRLGIPGMRVMQFGFGRHAHHYLPHCFDRLTAAYTGTHDNNTTRGWWEHEASEEERRDAIAYLGEDPAGIHWAFIRALNASPAKYSIVPMQDVLGLGSEARMNVPSRADGNWTWRLTPGSLSDQAAARLARLAEVCDRVAPAAPQPSYAEFMA